MRSCSRLQRCAKICRNLKNLKESKTAVSPDLTAGILPFFIFPAAMPDIIFEIKMHPARYSQHDFRKNVINISLSVLTFVRLSDIFITSQVRNI